MAWSLLLYKPLVTQTQDILRLQVCISTSKEGFHVAHWRDATERLATIVRFQGTYGGGTQAAFAAFVQSILSAKAEDASIASS